ncbi:LysR family transcriptional regulator [Psychromonas aquimarina]|uniref:LysR family transcriptional regulator n=1 Tax=Psychromonas aquimarina TaxID=444919 RepID=UPI00049085E2|nr:LysR family transcriptional regulator [Psychromonas aquimarina]
MDLNLIKPFPAVYKYQLITTAAESLDLTQSVLSAVLRRLEKRLNKKLFVKEGRGITPTSAAAILTDKLENVMGLIENELLDNKDTKASKNNHNWDSQHSLTPSETAVLTVYINLKASLYRTL